MRVLVAWIGLDDMLHAEGKPAKGPPTLTLALKSDQQWFDAGLLLHNQVRERAERYLAALGSGTHPQLDLHEAPINPVDYAAIHTAAVAGVERARAKYGPETELIFFLNSGTPPMGSMWLLLGKGRYRARFTAWSTHDNALQDVQVPFEISADFVPSLLEKTDTALREASAEKAPIDGVFSKMAFRCRAMHELIARAQRVAVHNVPVLIEGETGTGKELLARAIHDASPRKGRPFIAVNCGAIPDSLIESELFGTVKGGFTGAETRDGKFKAADGGTLFLDEVGELPHEAQVKLLRPLENGEVQPVGSVEVHKVDVRIIAATHRDIATAVTLDKFREDLFYRLAVAVLKVPPLRDREGDLPLIVERVLADINAQNAKLNIEARSLSAAARNRLRQHSWPGNVRELANTLRRAIVWSSPPTLSARDIEEALLRRPAGADSTDVMNRPIGEGFHLDRLLDEVQKAYIEKAMTLAGGKKVEAARLLGFKSHQVLMNRMKPFSGGVSERSRWVRRRT